MPIAIPLSQSKVAYVDEIDADLAALRWSAHKNRNVYYAIRNVRLGVGRKTSKTLHRVIADRMGIVGKVDHINRDGLDCTRQNLRPATSQQNAANARLSASNTSGAKGVSWNTSMQKWQVGIKVNGRSRHLGFYADFGTARAVAETARALALPALTQTATHA